MNEKISFKEKLLTYYSYNKYKLPIVFSLIGLIFLTAFPSKHYAYWYEPQSKFNAVSVFILMILALVQLVNAINLSAKNNRKSELFSTIIFTVFNVLIIVFAYIYISAYFKHGYKPKYLDSIVIISLGVVFYVIANVFAFIFLGYDTKRTLNEIIKELDNEIEEDE